MEENMNRTVTEAENIADAGAQGKNSEPKMFTQEEVNGFVQNRINRMRSQIEKESKAEYEKKFAELQAREMKLMAREALDSRGMPRELAEIITCADENDLNSKLDALEKIYGSSAAVKKQNEPAGFRQVGAAQTGNAFKGPDPVREAMGLKQR